MINKQEIIEKIVSLMLKHNLGLTMFDITISDNLEDFYIKINSNVNTRCIAFYKDVLSLSRVSPTKDVSCFTFDGWKTHVENVLPEHKQMFDTLVAKYLLGTRTMFNDYWWPFFKDMFSLIEEMFEEERSNHILLNKNEIKNILNNKVNILDNTFKIDVDYFLKTMNVTLLYSKYKIIFFVEHDNISIANISLDNTSQPTVYMTNYEGWHQFKNSFINSIVHKKTLDSNSKFIKETIDLKSIVTFVGLLWPIIHNIYEELEKRKIEKDEIIKLVPINKNLRNEDPDSYRNYLNSRDEQWYKNLVDGYLNNKSNIGKKHYQEQAHLHGLKFTK